MEVSKIVPSLLSMADFPLPCLISDGPPTNIQSNWQPGWAAFAAWGLLESLEYVDYPLASQLKNSSFIESAKEQTIKAGRGWSTMALKNHSESAWIHHLGQSENGVYSQNDHLMGHMMASRNGFGIPPKNQTNIIPTFQGHSCHPLPK